MQGVYAFFGVTAFWRALAGVGTESPNRRAAFEFAYWRGQTWQTLQVLREDPGLTPAGRRFVDGIAKRLGAWQVEPVQADVSKTAAAVAADHYAGWRIRYLRPAPETVAALAEAWLAGGKRALRTNPGSDRAPTPVPDGSWSHARADLVHVGMGAASPVENVGLPGQNTLTERWATVPDATPADFAYVTGRLTDAVRGYRAELARDPDRPASWIGLGLALSGLGASPAAHALLRRPELVRALHRSIRKRTTNMPRPDDLAAWIGRSV